MQLRHRGGTAGEPRLSPELGLRSWTDLLAARRMVQGLTATGFQRSTYPSWLQSRIEVIHEGVDGALCHPDPLARFQVPGGPRLSGADPVVSFAARWLEPLRGFPQFMRALPALLRSDADVQIVIAGREGEGGYGPPPAGHPSWKTALLEELAGELDPERIHFCGLLPHADLIRLFQITTVHVHLTLPYVLSWSLLEAMACGALIVGSRTEPLEEVIRPGWNGLLTEIHDSSALSDLLLSVLRDPRAHQACRASARRTVLRYYERNDCCERRVRWLECLAGRAEPEAESCGGGRCA
jgi:glycosyltransferase involved in cell wall biosynthesis